MFHLCEAFQSNFHDRLKQAEVFTNVQLLQRVLVYLEYIYDYCELRLVLIWGQNVPELFQVLQIRRKVFLNPTL